MSAIIWPSIRKAIVIKGRTLTFRNAAVKDADFVLSLYGQTKRSLGT